MLLVFTEQTTAQTLTVTPTSLTINEGETGTYTVKLSSQPTGDVTVTVTPSDDTARCGDGHGTSCTNKSGVATVDRTSLTFTTSNWSVAQTVTVTATDEDMAGVFKFAKITNQVSGGGNSVAVRITVLDDDSRGVTHYQMASDGTVGTKFAAVGLYENHGDGGFYVQLNTEPSATTTVTLASAHPDSVSVTTKTLTFTQENWNDPQLVRFTVIDNFIDGEEPDFQVAISLTPGGTGSDYVGQGLVPFTVNVLDDDTRGVTHYRVADDGTSIGIEKIWVAFDDRDLKSGFYTKLNSEPTAATTVTVTSSMPDQLQVTSEALTFTSTNWNDPQPVRLNLVGNWIDEDGKGEHRVHTIFLYLTPTGMGSDYDGQSLASFEVDIWNDDFAGIVLSPTALTISEGEEAQYSVKLSSEPTTSVTVELSGQEETVLNLDKTSLTFTSENWRVAQTVMVTADHDADGVDETVTLAHASSGGEYDELTANLPSTVTDVNEWPVVSASCDPCTVSWGRPVSLAATASDPDGDVLTYEWSAPKGRFGESTDNAVAHWTAPDEAGTVPISITVDDGRGGSALTTVDVEVVNAVPQFGPAVYHFELAENVDGRKRPVELGQLTALDADGDALTYVLASGNRDLFAVEAEDGVVTYVGPGEDFETDPNRYNLTVLARDPAGGQAKAKITVKVTDVNEEPTVSASCDPCSVSRRGEMRLAATAFDPDGDVLTYEWSAPKGRFGGSTDNAVVHWIAPDEAGPITIRVTVYDGRGGSALATVDVEVVNSVPQFESDVYHFELAENLSGRQKPVELGQLTASDTDGDALTYALVSGNRDLFVVGAEDGVVSYVGPGEDFETEPNRYDLTVQAQDAVGGETEVFITVTVIDVNETPTVSASCDPCTVSRGGEVLLVATAFDPDGDVLTYEWNAPDGSFGGLTDKASARWIAPDEAGPTTISIAVEDGRGGSALATVDVEVANAVPRFGSAVYHFELAENVDGRHRPVKLGQLMASDSDGDALTYALVSGNRDLFAVGAEDGVVTYVGPGEDFETEPSLYSLLGVAQDAVGGKTEIFITVTVTDVNETPTVSASCDPCTVSRGGEVLLAATTTDPDGDGITCLWSAPIGHFRGQTDSLIVQWIAPDQVGPVTISVAIEDGRGGSALATVDLQVVNAGPQFELKVYHFELAENVVGRHRPVELGQLTASDPDGEALTYSIVSGNRDLFAVGAEDGVVTYVGPGEDFETGPGRYDLKVQAQDAIGLDAQAKVTVTVTDVNEAPKVSASCDPCTVSRGGEVRLAATASDPDGDVLTYEWSAPAGRFGGRTDSAAVHWIAPDEAGPATISVAVKDGRDGSALATVDVEVVNAVPQFGSAGYYFELAENLDGRHRPVELGQLTASDSDGDALTYALVSGNRDLFAVGAEDGVVTYVGPGRDFETDPGLYDLRVQVQDAVGGEADAEITVTVTDVNETPTVFGDVRSMHGVTGW